MAEENHGCFAWLISFKNSCNERWARFRNRFRQGFFVIKGEVLDPETLLNETGARDMVIRKTPYKSNQVVPQSLAPVTAVKDDAILIENASLTETTDEDFDTLVGEYVFCIIDKAADSLRQASPGNTKSIREKSADDGVSLSSSIISQIADIAVTESLSNVVLEDDVNHSAIHDARPKTIKEFMETFGIVGDEVADDGLPTVSL
ncbi:uncharacterized protein LOC123560797 [Mercenaria mercenaria]|uniref:uncharacterized protein LOC123560797 n=1 Tax=Mercenaria mercenaria TaxID=6596 RepID=UPI00234E8901|nr:uncharacterized protein LOC123560797 [Mercenaria mercenaria]